MHDGLTRRGVLASTGALSLSLAGCLGDFGPTGSTDGTPDGAPAVSFTAEVRRSFADEHPATLRLALVNEGDESLVVRWNVSGGQGGPFNAVWGTRRDGDAEVGVFRRDGSAALCVPGDGSPIPDTPDGDCWKPPCEEIDLPSLHGRFELAPGEPTADEYVVLDWFGRPCLQPGTYEFDEARAGVGASVARGTVDGASVTTESGWYSLERHLALSIAEDRDVTASAEVVVSSPETPEGDDGSTPRPTPKPVDGVNSGGHG